MIAQQIIDYIENNLFYPIEYDKIEKIVYYGKYNIMRIFSASTKYTIGEYIRVRRLSEAGKLISGTDKTITDIAMECGYSSSASFAKAFKQFNGFSAVECRTNKKYKYIPALKLCPDIYPINCEVVCFDRTCFIGYGKRFKGKAESRMKQDEAFIVSTRRMQDALRLFRNQNDFNYWEIMENFDETGYDYFCMVERETSPLDFSALAERSKEKDFDFSFAEAELKELASTLNKKEIIGKYAKFTDEYRNFPMQGLDGFTQKAYFSLEKHNYKRDEIRPELLCVHWTKRDRISERHLELFIPIK